MENKFSVWDNDLYRGNIPLKSEEKEEWDKLAEHSRGFVGKVEEDNKDVSESEIYDSQKPIPYSQGTKTSPFVTFLQVLSVLSILLGLVMFIAGLNSYHGEMLVLFGLVGGIFGSTFWWALSIIIKACQKYLKDK